VATDDGHIHLAHVQALALRHKGVGAHLLSETAGVIASPCPALAVKTHQEALRACESEPNRLTSTGSGKRCQPESNASLNALACDSCSEAVSMHMLLRLRTTSRVDTPSSLRLSYTPAAFSTSAAMGTVELTGLEMMLMIACKPGDLDQQSGRQNVH